jgi:hypothetical protein
VVPGSGCVVFPRSRCLAPVAQSRHDDEREDRCAINAVGNGLELRCQMG